MKTVSFIILVIAIVMLLHITLTNILFGYTLYKKHFKCCKYWIIKGIADIVLIGIVITITVLLKDTNYYFITDVINGFIIGWIFSDYYFRYL